LILQDIAPENLPDFVLFIGAKMEPSCKNLSLPRFASISTRVSAVSAEKVVQLFSTD
jgi:hypothetical protein